MDDQVTCAPLASPSLLHSWLAFVTKCFSDKTPPPTLQYFKDHYDGDINALSTDILVATTTNSDEVEIVSTLRIFRRLISVKTVDGSFKLVKAGGIGEVCTISTHMRRGLSRRLFELAQNKMFPPQSQAFDESSSTEDCDVSILHAAPAYQAFYNKLGYSQIPSAQTFVFPLERLLDKKNPAALPTNAYFLESPLSDLQQEGESSLAFKLSDIHSRTSSNSVGYFPRSAAYWKTWCLKDCERNALPSSSSGFSVLAIGDGSDEIVVGWMLVRKTSDVMYQIRDFGFDPKCALSISLVFGALLSHCLSSVEANGTRVKVHQLVINKGLQHLVLPLAGDEEAANAVEVEVDDGWMWKINPNRTQTSDDIAPLSEQGGGGVWGVDNF
jgi:hypothetical protein